MSIRQEIERGIYTTDITQAKVCGHIKWEYEQIQKIWHEQGLPQGFDDGEVVPLFRKDGAGVMLMNDRYELCVLGLNSRLMLEENA